MRTLILFRVVIMGMFLLVVVSAISAFAANLTVSSPNIGYASHRITANNVKPAFCTQNLTDIVSGSGIINGTSGNDLIIGSSGNDTINGLGGDDCILGGGGVDIIDGGDGTDTCGMGSGNTYTNCENIH
jgi:Ca2+-binding RTX toxin-like protein